MIQKLLGKGSVEVMETTSFVGEKDSATLIMQEEFPLAKTWDEVYPDGIILDYLGRHDKRTQWKAPMPDSAYTLDECPALGGVDLEKFISPLL
jgi:hypothetical protein